jgi:NADPH:quinone reductase-like Zn-dependent oxidoreductase
MQGKMMKALLYTRYGGIDAMEVKEIALPILQSGLVRVKVKAVSLNPMDWMIRSGEFAFMTGKKFPRFMGGDFSGVVESVGDNVKRFKVGDEVFGVVDEFSAAGHGCMQEYVAVTEKQLYIKPEQISFNTACCLPVVGVSALAAIDSIANVKAGNEVLIMGCTGGVGILANQIAKRRGGVVTGVCSTGGVPMAETLCDVVIDYTKEDVMKGAKRFDVILQFSSLKLHYRDMRHLLKPVGVFVDSHPEGIYAILTELIRNVFAKQQDRILMAQNHMTLENFKKISDLAKDGLKVEISKVFPFTEAIAAYELAEKGKNIGKIVVEFN